MRLCLRTEHCLEQLNLERFGMNVSRRTSHTCTVVSRHLILTLSLSLSILSFHSASAQALISEFAKLAPTDLNAADQFGGAVGIGGGQAIVGSINHDSVASNAGAAWVFNSSTGALVTKLEASDGELGDNFGFSTAVGGGLALVGATGEDNEVTNLATGSGAAYLFNSTTGAQVNKFEPDDGQTNDGFGRSVDIGGGLGAIGNPGDDDANSDAGSVFLYNLTTGSNLHILTAGDAGTTDQLGSAVATDGTHVVGGAPGADAGSTVGAGAAYVFDTSTGTQQHKLTASDGVQNDLFGISVDISGDRIIIGAPFHDADGETAGAAYVFDTSDGSQLFKLVPDDIAAGDQFGISVGISGDFAIIGSEFDDDDGLSSGSAYVFDLTTGNQISKFTASDAAQGDFLGGAVALDAGKAIIGATLDDDLGNSSGSAYLASVPEPEAYALFISLTLTIFCLYRQKIARVNPAGAQPEA